MRTKSEVTKRPLVIPRRTSKRKLLFKAASATHPSTTRAQRLQRLQEETLTTKMKNRMKPKVKPTNHRKMMPLPQNLT